VDRVGARQLVAEHGERPAAVQSLPISYRGTEVGRLLLPRDGVRASLLSRDERLLADVVRQAAAAAHAGALAAELQQSREQLVTAREEERRRLRRDLHDGLGPSLGAVVLRIDTARNLTTAGNAEEADRLLRQARSDVAAALADVRRLVNDLRPPALDDLGLAGAVRQQAERQLAPRTTVTIVRGASSRSACWRTAPASPRSSSAGGRRSWTRRRTSASAAATSSRACRSSRSASSARPAVVRLRAVSIRRTTAPRLGPIPSCRSRRSRRRSSSRAVTSCSRLCCSSAAREPACAAAAA